MVLALSGLMLIRLLENESLQDFLVKCCLKNSTRMSIAAEFSQEEFRFGELGEGVFGNGQIYLPFLCKCRRGFELPSLSFYSENGKGHSVYFSSLILGSF